MSSLVRLLIRRGHRAEGATSKMPLARYFLYVGGLLLALLFITDAVLPNLPVEDRANTELPVIRIHSDRKWPERVVFDTSTPMVAPAQTQTAKAEAQAANTEAAAPAPAPPTVTDASGKGRGGEAFAQLQPSDVKQLQSPDRKKADPKPQQHKRRVARSRVGPPTMLVAQQPRFGFGWFDNGPWHSTW